MNTSDRDTLPPREVVGVYADLASFERAIAGLTAAGFDHSDLSVLSSHESIEAATAHEGKSWRDVLNAVSDEVKYAAPLVAAGVIAVSAGPIGAAIAAAIAAGVSGAAAKQMMDEVTAHPHSEAFARALEAGSIILWVVVADPSREDKARAILAETGAANIHVHQRKPV